MTIIATPGRGREPEDEEDMLDAMVKYLKDEIKFVDVFLIAFKESDTRITRDLRAHLFSAMFGPKLWNNVIVGAFHEEQKEEIGVQTEEERLSNMDLWKNTIKEQFSKMNQNWKNMDAVFIDSHYRPSDPTGKMIFMNETNRLLRFAKETKSFPLKDVQTVQREFEDFRTQLNACEENQTVLEKQRKDLNVKLNTCKQTQTSLKPRHEEKLIGEGTKLALVGGAGLLLGFLLAGAIWTWRRVRQS